MAVFKCKMCGGNIVADPGRSIGACDSCGTVQTIPLIDDDRRAELYNRANHYRRNHEFDKAAGIYEMILNEDSADAESYWALVLCKYGIEYVTDPATRRYVPTYNRMQYTSVYADENYKAAIARANNTARRQYEQEAAELDRIQQRILEIAAREEPFDVFICYKETDARGNRTLDSVLAQEIYDALQHEGIKTFFSRITLENKLGVQYEPYIFAALNSAKVMLVVGTEADNLNALWVKNEWSRFLALRAEHPEKQVFPVYKGMSPYDLPDEFSVLQAQDMGKIGAMQDLVRGVLKIVRTAEKPQQKESADAGGVTPLLKRAFLSMEDGNFSKADQLLEQVLNANPELTAAYIGKLMVHAKARNASELSSYTEVLCLLPEYKRAMQFASDADRTALKQIDAENRKAAQAHAFQLLRDDRFGESGALFRQLVSAQPELSEAHVGSLMAGLYVREERDLAECSVDFSNEPAFQNALAYAQGDRKAQLLSYQRSASEKAARELQAETAARLEKEQAETAARLEKERAETAARLDAKQKEEKRAKKQRTRNTISGIWEVISITANAAGYGALAGVLPGIVACSSAISSSESLENFVTAIIICAALGAIIGFTVGFIGYRRRK